MLENNPLKQYFRRPAIYVNLPSDGKYYQPGVVEIPPNREIPVYPMTTLDEMTIRTPDGLFNGSAVVALIKSCIPSILDPWQLNNIDLDAMLVAIKAASGNGKMEIGSTCPACSEETSYDVDLLPILASIQSVDYTQSLRVHELEIRFRPLAYYETNANNMNQFKIQKMVVGIDEIEDEDQKREAMGHAVNQLNELILGVIAQTIEYIKTPETIVTDKSFIIDFLNNTDKQTSTLIKERSVELREQNEMKPIAVTCPHCQHQYKQRIVLNVTDFFE
jgi:hypothetical protein